MRRMLLTLGIVAAGCAADAMRPESDAPPARHVPAARLPSPLRRLVLNHDNPTALPVEFDHALHAAQAAGGSCASCHHELRERPAAIPSACTVCHMPVYLVPRVDESAPHEHALPPDL